jgi:hypothetical protein
VSILLNPEGHSDEQRYELAPRRFTSLDGATIGLLGNTKLNADAILAAIGDQLRGRYAVEAIIARTKPTFSQPAPKETVDEMAAACDVVLTGVGD